MKHSLRTSILIFILLHFFAGLAWSTPAPEIKDGLLYYTDRFGARTSVPIEDIDDIHHEVFQIPVPDNASAKLQEQIRLRNLQHSWIDAKHYIRVGREIIDIDLAQSIEIVRARQMKNEPLHPNTYLTDVERQHINTRINEARSSILEKGRGMESQIPQAKKKTATTDLVDQAVQKSGAIWTLVLDGIPYFVSPSPDNALLRYTPDTKLIEVSPREILSCNLSTSPTTSNNLRIKINGDTRTYYSNLVGSFSIANSTTNRLLIGNTATGNAFCTTGPSERIFSNGFESGGVQ